MANNQYVNKVVFGGNTLIDLSSDTVTSVDVASGKTFHLATGEQATGTGSGGGTTRYIDLYDNSATITADPDVNYIWINNQPEAISVGDRYRVTWNNVAYTFTAINDPTIGSQYGNTFGNPSILGGTDDGSNAPFCAFKASWSDNELIVSTSDSAGTISLKIEKIVYGDNLNLQSKTVTQNGTVTADSGYDALSSVNVNVSGGVSKHVTGTFTTGSTSGAIDVTIPYTGSGYPTAVMVYVEGGAYNSNNTDWYNAIDRYAIAQTALHKSEQNTTPSYTGNGTNDTAVVATIYKSSTSSATQYTRTSSMNSPLFKNEDATSSSNGVYAVRMKSSTIMSIFVKGSSYGFMKSTTYRYHIIYS